jgi:hypothetical protein
MPETTLPLALDAKLEVTINASAEACFKAMLHEFGPGMILPEGTSMNLKLEAFPGGRWFRDLGNNAGHLWGHVQVIKPPTLLEICGPLFMSYPAVSHIQYRFTSEGPRTTLAMTHRAIGLITDEHREGVSEGWAFCLQRVREIAESRRR